MAKVQVQGYSKLVRDMESGAIINTSKTEYVQFMEARNNRLADKERVQSMCDELNTLKQEFTEIKDLLLKVLEK